MNNRIDSMLKKYDIKTSNDRINALKEIIQEIVVCALAKNDFFEEAAFYGGTALRIFHKLDRFSEDLDFALIKPNKNFDLKKYFKAIEDTLKSYEFEMKASYKEKSNDSNVDSAFVKGDTKQMIINFFPGEKLKNDGFYKQIKIKFEVDVNPPAGATYEVKTKTDPELYMARLYDMPSLYAGKLHAVLCRNWKQRTKGRDLYDFIFYLRSHSKINMELLRNKLIESNSLKENDKFDIDVLKKMLKKKFKEIDYESAKEDVIELLDDRTKAEFWNSDVFVSLVDNIEE